MVSPFGSQLSQRDDNSKAMQAELQTWKALHVQSKDSATPCMSDLSLLTPMGRSTAYSPRTSKARGLKNTKKEINIKSRAFDLNNKLQPTVTTIFPKAKEKQSRPCILKAEKLNHTPGTEKPDASRKMSNGNSRKASKAVEVEIKDQVTQSNEIENTIMTLYPLESATSHRVDLCPPPNIITFSKHHSRIVLHP